jgi:GTP cyclohydrolase IA
VRRTARVVEAYARRLQIQEKMTAQIANIINDVLKPNGRRRDHQGFASLLSTRGVRKHNTDLVTSRMLGCFRDNPMTRQEFLALAD